jgi:hypothetical protein
VELLSNGDYILLRSEAGGMEFSLTGVLLPTVPARPIAVAAANGFASAIQPNGESVAVSSGGRVGKGRLMLRLSGLLKREPLILLSLRRPSPILLRTAVRLNFFESEQVTLSQWFGGEFGFFDLNVFWIDNVLFRTFLPRWWARRQ